MAHIEVRTPSVELSHRRIENDAVRVEIRHEASTPWFDPCWLAEFDVLPVLSGAGVCSLTPAGSISDPRRRQSSRPSHWSFP